MTEPRLSEIVARRLIVPIRSSSGEQPDPERVPTDGLRHGNDAEGAFLAAFTTPELFAEHGPPGSDTISLPARELFERAEAAGSRVVINPGSAAPLVVPVALLPFLAAGVDPNSPEAIAARRPYGQLPPLEAPTEVPEPFGAELRAALVALPQVARAWLLRVGSAWTAGIELDDATTLADFDEVRNRLHSVANEHLGSRRELAVTDLRAPSMREAYDQVAAPFYVREPEHRNLLSRLFGG